MKRLQLMEIHEQPWCPRVIRDGVTDFLQYSEGRWGYYSELLPAICFFIQRLRAPRIVDLCSGGSGPWLRMCRTIARIAGESFRIVLTDKFPNVEAFRVARTTSGGTIDFRDDPVDVAAIPAELSGFRTMFGSFHHFPPPVALAILQHAVDSGQGIGIFEMTDRRFGTMIKFLAAPLFVLVHTPAIRPLSLPRLLLTYLLPVIPLVVMIDGIVSCLRSYTTDELAAMADSLRGAPYDWEIRQIPSGRSPFPVVYAIGCPRKEMAC